MEGAKRVVVKLGDEQIISLTDVTPKFRDTSLRHKMYTSIKDGMSVAEFLSANGGRKVAGTYLAWFANVAGVVNVK